VMAGLGDLRARPDALPALVVCHRGVIRLALAALLGDDDEGARVIANAELVTLPEPAAGA
jgi:broad specificity phosphatase PhoE